MSLRLMAVVAVVAVLAVLFGWQYRRDQLVKACVEAGGVWKGQNSICLPAIRPILKRELERG